MSQDVKEKRAKYIGKNNEINKEFYFAHPRTKFQINSIWNSHFSGCVLWDLFSQEAEQVYSTYNQSVKIMWDIPRGANWSNPSEESIDKEILDIHRINKGQ